MRYTRVAHCVPTCTRTSFHGRMNSPRCFTKPCLLLYRRWRTHDHEQTTIWIEYKTQAVDILASEPHPGPCQTYAYPIGCTGDTRVNVSETYVKHGTLSRHLINSQPRLKFPLFSIENDIHAYDQTPSILHGSTGSTHMHMYHTAPHALSLT